MNEPRNVQKLDGESGAIIINPDATELDLIDMIDERLAQLQAMMAVKWNKVDEAEPDFHKQQRGAYLWLFNRTVCELDSLSHALWDKYTD